jgi:protein TonB
MLPEQILRSDLLEILFENRNKSYGAYELRSRYPGRLTTALFMSLLFFALTLYIAFLINRQSQNQNSHAAVLVRDYSIQPISFQSNPRELKVHRLQKFYTRLRTPDEVSPTIVHEKILPPPPGPAPAPDQEGPAGKNIFSDGYPGPGSSLQDNGIPNAPEQNSSGRPEENEPFRIAEVMPVFPGGMEALKRFLLKNLRMPNRDTDADSVVHVLVEFVVDESGGIKDFSFLQSGGREFDEEVLRVLKKMPVWKPGMQNGRSVPVFFRLPVLFRAPEGN